MARIGIDPGHGGSDPGACNGQYRECDFTLAVAMELKNMLLADGHDVTMTRETDVDVYGPNASDSQELSARCEILNNANVDLSISIHCNAAANPLAIGTETFHMDCATRSSMLAQYVHVELTNLGLVNRGTKTANFALIRDTNSPAVLVELAFISNEFDLDILITRQWALAQCLYTGVKHWLTSYGI